MTNTPSVHETLADLWLGPDGFLRVVYTAFNTAGEGDVYMKTFFVGTGGADPIADLIALVQSFQLQPHGIENSLVVKLQHAGDAFAAGDVAGGCALINAFINEVQAQTGKHITGGTGGPAGQLLTSADQIKAAHGCP